MTEQNLLWHYTTAAGLVGMLTEHKLWATSLSFMNDPGEADYAASVLQEAVRAIDSREGRYVIEYLENAHFDGYEQGFSERFVVCASAAADSLDLWRSYGPSALSGTFAVGLDRNAPLGVLEIPKKSPLGVLEMPKKSSSLHTTIGWSDVRYESRSEVVARVRGGLADGIQEVRAQFGTPDVDFDRHGLELWRVADDQFSRLVAAGKHHAYQSECEARLVWSVDTSREDSYRIRPGRFGPVAYVELTSVQNWGDTASCTNQLPIREIIIWPGAPRAARNGVAAALRHGGFSHDLEDGILHDHSADDYNPPVRIRMSNVPFV